MDSSYRRFCFLFHFSHEILHCVLNSVVVEKSLLFFWYFCPIFFDVLPYVLTAGHCAGAPGEFSGMRNFTESDVEAGRGVTNNYPFGGGASIEAVRCSDRPGDIQHYGRIGTFQPQWQSPCIGIDRDN